MQTRSGCLHCPLPVADSGTGHGVPLVLPEPGRSLDTRLAGGAWPCWGGKEHREGTVREPWPLSPLEELHEGECMPHPWGKVGCRQGGFWEGSREAAASALAPARLGARHEAEPAEPGASKGSAHPSGAPGWKTRTPEETARGTDPVTLSATASASRFPRHLAPDCRVAVKNQAPEEKSRV